MTVYAAGTPAAFDGVKGVTPAIMTVAKRAYQVAYADAYRTVFLSSIAFSSVGFLLSLFVPNVDDRMTNEVATVLQARGRGEIVPTVQEKEILTALHRE